MFNTHMLPLPNYKLLQIQAAIIIFLSSFNFIYPQHYTHSYIDSILIHENEKLRLTGKKKELLLLNKKFIDLSKQQNYVRGEVLGYINIGNIYATVGSYNTCQQYLQMAEEKIKNTNDFYLYTRLYQEYAQYNYVVGLQSKALKYNAQSIYYGKQITNPTEKKILSNIYANRADFLYYNGSPDSSLVYLHKALVIKPTPVINCLIANHYLDYKKKPDSSSYYIHQALFMLKKFEYWNIQRGMTYYYCGNYYSQNKDYTKALNYYRQSVKILEKTQRIYTIPHLYKTIAETYKKIKDEDNERLYLEKYTRLKDSLNQVWNKTINLSVDQTINEKNHEVKTKKNTVLLYNVAIGVLVAVILIFFWFSHKKGSPTDQQPPNTDHNDNKSDLLKSANLDMELMSLAKKNDPLFIARFQEINPELIKKILLINPGMTRNELSLCAMIWLGFSSKEIAQYSFMQHRSVQTKKNRLRKKLNIASDIDLNTFFKTL